jgi:hypothetical protein
MNVTAANAIQPTPLIPCTFNGPSPICPPYVYQSPGGVEYSLYGGGAPWAQQLFWQDVPQYAPGSSWPPTGDGYPVPLIGQIGSGVDLYEANGGGTVDGVTYPNYSQTPGYIQYAAWMNAHTDPSTLKAADIPSAWLLHDANRLPAGELAKLQAVAPVYDILLPQGSTQGGSSALSGADLALTAGPVHAAGTGLNMLAFIDQNGSIILMVTNQDGTDQNAGALVFNDVSNGSFNLLGLLGTSSTAMTVVNNTATVPISVAAYDTVVYEIPALKWIGH